MRHFGGSASGFGQLAAGESEAFHAEPLGGLDGAPELDGGALAVAAVVALQQGAGEPVPGSGREGR